MADEQLAFDLTLDAAPVDVFYAFATAQGWRNWMCDSARFEPRAGGSYQLAWSSGWFTSGSVKKIVPGAGLELTWRGKDDAGMTEVSINLEAHNGGTKLSILHQGFGESEAGNNALQEARKGWEMGLENLESIFDDGKDLRFIRRPLLGIFINDFDEKIANELGVPVSQGVRIDSPVEGLGADKAGLQTDDVIVEMNGVPIAGFADMRAVLDGQYAGDVVPVVAYRRGEKRSFAMELSGRTTVEVPLDPAAIADQLRDVYSTVVNDLRAMFDGVSEEEAGMAPAPDEWSAKDVLAHFIDSETYTHVQITDYFYDGNREFADNAGNVHERIHAIVDTTPTIEALLDRFALCKEETLAILMRAEKLKARKGVLWRLGQSLLQDPDVHERNHMDQIQAALDAAKGK